MDKQTDRLPWIIAGVSAACAAAALAVSSIRLAPATSPATSSTMAHPLPTLAPGPALAPVSPPAPAPAPAPATAAEAIAAPPVVSAPMAPASAEAAPAGGQIWECTTNGQKTFSDKPCGSKATLRELSSINIMNPTPASPGFRSFQQPEPEYPPDYSYPDAPQESSSAYPVYIAVPYRERRKPDHVHRPYHPNHGALPRKT